MNERRNGYYEVLFNDEWLIAVFNNGHWYIAGYTGQLQESDFEQIDEQQIMLKERLAKCECFQPHLWEICYAKCDRKQKL